jgi:hypothetical protein
MLARGHNADKEINARRGLILWVFALSSLFLQTSLAAPHAWVDKPLWDFGAVTNLDELEHSFVVRNIGDSSLIITRAVSGCSACLSVESGRMEIAPGSSNVIRCRLDLRALRGAISRAIAVECNDPKNPAFALGLSGIVVPAFQIEPADITIDVSRGETSASANIWPELPLHGGLTRVSSDDANVEASIASGYAAKSLISVRLKTAPARGDTIANLTAATSDSNDPVCRFHVVIHNPGDLEWLPGRLEFEPQAEPQSRNLLLKQHGTNFLTLLDAISPSARFHCEIEPEPFSRNYRIYVTARDQDSATNGYNTSLLLKLKNSSNQLTNVNIPITIEAQ